MIGWAGSSKMRRKSLMNIKESVLQGKNWLNLSRAYMRNITLM